MTIEERIERRKKIRTRQVGRIWRKNALKMLCAICDDYLEHRIRADKVQEGVLKDIQFDIASINIRQEIEGTIADINFERKKVMSKETRITHGAQVLLQEAEKAFEIGDRIRGISLVKDSLVFLGNGYEQLTTEATQPAESEKDTVDLPASESAESAPEPAAEQPAESSNEPKPGAIKPFELPKSKDGAGVVSEPV